MLLFLLFPFILCVCVYVCHACVCTRVCKDVQAYACTLKEERFGCALLVPSAYFFEAGPYWTWVLGLRGQAKSQQSLLLSLPLLRARVTGFCGNAKLAM